MASGDQDCTDPALPYCADKACVECVESTDCPVAGTVWHADNDSCRAPCTDHTECASEVCQEELGTFVDELNVLYVDPRGDDAGDCTLAAPCQSLARAIELATAERFWVRMSPGSYAGSVRIERDLNVVGRAGATLVGTVPDRPVVTVTGGASVRLESLVVRDTQGDVDGIDAHGISCDGGSSLDLLQVSSVGNRNRGLNGSGCQMQIDKSDLSGNGGAGLAVSEDSIAVYGGSAVVRDSKLNDNEGSGVVAHGSSSAAVDLVVRDSEIAHNGGVGVVSRRLRSLEVQRSIVSDNQRGGVEAEDVSVILSNNWIVENDFMPGFTTSPGVLLLGNSVGRIEHNTIVGNVDGVESDVDQDIDGDPRPQGDGPDMGADEVTSVKE